MHLRKEKNTIIVEGNIKTIQDSETLKSEIKDVSKECDAIELVLQDSISITSSVIGFLVKLSQKDKKDITLKVTNETLYELLHDLNLHTIFHIQKV